MKKIMIRTLALLLVVLMLLGSTACQGKLGKPLMTLRKDGIKVTLSVNIYELMLTRMKGVLYATNQTHNGLDVSSPLFWECQDVYDGKMQTFDEYYSNIVLENCRTYLAILYLFEKNVGKLSDADIEEIDKLMDELLETDGDGSMTKLNAVLSEYGVNANILRAAYELDYKTQAVKDALYGKNASNIGYNFKNAFLEENYVHFRQIFLPTTNNVYKTDQFGNDVYYYPADHEKSGRIYYDVNNGIKATNDDGSDLLDGNGDVVYYVAGSAGKKIAYNTVQGEREPVFDGSSIKTTPMTDAEKEIVALQKDGYMEMLKDSTNEEFEKAMLDYLREVDKTAEISQYDDGYYIPTNLAYSAETEAMALIADALADAKIGDVIAVQSSSGWHIVKKYAHTDKAYEKEENEVYFSDFYDQLTEQLLFEECQKLFDEIVVNERVLAKAPTIKAVAINGKYTYY